MKRAIHNQAFTLIEMLVTIAIVGILSAVAIINLSPIDGKARAGVSQNLVETLNDGVKRFGHANYSIPRAADSGTDDEIEVLRTLQWRDVDSPGSPYARPDWQPGVSADDSDYRIQWNGRTFQLLRPGTAGAGLQVVFDSSDVGTPYDFPSGYKPLGQN